MAKAQPRYSMGRKQGPRAGKPCQREGGESSKQVERSMLKRNCTQSGALPQSLIVGARVEVTSGELSRYGPEKVGRQRLITGDSGGDEW